MKDNNLRVLHVYRTYFPDPPGGLQEAIRQIALATRKLGVESRVFTLSPNFDPIIIDRPEALIYRAKLWASPASCDLGGFQSFQTFAELSDWADIIHFHFPWPFADVLKLIVSRNKKVIMTYHSDIIRQRLPGLIYSPLRQWMMKSMDFIVATSPAYFKTSPFLSSPKHRERVKVIPLGIDEQSYPHQGDETILQRLKIENEEPFFLFIGVLRYYKGLESLVKAATMINAKIVIAGTGPEGNTLKTLAKKLDLSNVIFAEQVSDAEKVTLLKHSYAFVLPSCLRSEAFGMVLVEASMFAKPMISCEIGTGTSYVNQDGITGIVIPPNAYHDLAAAMNKLLSNRSLTIQYGLAARDRYESFFSGPSLGAAYLTLYQETLKN